MLHAYDKLQPCFAKRLHECVHIRIHTYTHTPTRTHLRTHTYIYKVHKSKCLRCYNAVDIFTFYVSIVVNVLGIYNYMKHQSI